MHQRYLNNNNIAVAGASLLGHGLTVADGKFGFFAEKNGWSYVVCDMVKLHDIAEKEYPDRQTTYYTPLAGENRAPTAVNAPERSR